MVSFSVFSVKGLSGKGLVPFLVVFVVVVVASGFFIAKAGELNKYQADVERAVRLSKETSDVQHYLVMFPHAQYHISQDKNHWLVSWYSPSSLIMLVVLVTIDKATWKVIDVYIAW
jgi:hypothetical protein